MSGPAILLREIHRLRRFAHELQEQIDRTPRQLKAHQAKVTRQEEIQHAAQEAIKKLKVSVHEKETTLKTTHAQVAKHQKQLNEAGSKKEFDALQVEVNHAKKLCLQLEDETLTGMGEIEEQTARLPELDKNVRTAREEYKKFEAGAGERTAALIQQMNETQTKLAEIEPGIPDDVRTQYNRMVAGMGADSFAAVVKQNCSACNTALTLQSQTELLMERFVVCKACGRMLYLPE